MPGRYAKRGNSVSELPLSGRILLQCELDRATVPLKIAALGPSPGQASGDGLRCFSTLRTRLPERDEHNTPLPSSKTQAQREAELSQLNGKLYTLAKAQFDKSCPAVANGPAESVVRPQTTSAVGLSRRRLPLKPRAISPRSK